MSLIAENWLKRYPSLETITAMFSDSNGVMRGKILPISSLDKLLTDGVLFPASVFALDITGEAVDASGLIWETGDDDSPWRVVEDSFHILPSSEGKAGAVLIMMTQADGTPHPLDPRGVLNAVIERLKGMGIYPVIAPELEFYLIDDCLDAMGMGQIAKVPRTGLGQDTNQVYGLDAYDDFAATLEAMKAACYEAAVGVDTAIAEYGRSQFEINLRHQKNCLRAADEAILLKRLSRLVARQHGHDVTFMGKPFADDTGSGFHLHVSLLDENGLNIMAENDGESETSNPNLGHAAAGMGRYLADCMAIFSPNANAWRRIQPGHYAPIDRSWGINNRTVSFRVPHGDKKSRRLEHRCGAADVNPYLATAVILAAMAEGIQQKLSPPPITTGNAYDKPDNKGLPKSWAEANAVFGSSDFIADWLGEGYRHVFFVTKEHERQDFDKAMTPLEWRGYR